MAEEANCSIYEGKVIQAITQPIFWAGVPRDLFIFNLLISILMVMIFHFFYFVVIAVTAHAIFVFLGKREPLFYEIFFRYNRIKKFYWA